MVDAVVIETKTENPSIADVAVKDPADKTQSTEKSEKSEKSEEIKEGVKEKTEGGKPDAASEKEGQKDEVKDKAKDGKEPEASESPKELKETEPKQLQNTELSQNREILRQQKFENDILTEQNTKLRSILQDKGLLSEEEIESIKKAGEPAETDDTLVQARQGQLNVLLETMSEGRHPDIKQFVTEELKDRLVADLAQNYADNSDEQVDILQLRESIEHELWFNQSNPWLFIQEQVKHRGYLGNAVVKVKEANASAPAAKEVIKMAKAPTSLAGVPGGGEVDGWTKDKINALPEDKLGDVPENIYKMYMQGTLN